MAYIAYGYVRIEETGDLFRYGLALEAYRDSLNTYRDSAIMGVYEMFYPVWYGLFYIITKLDLRLEHLNFLAGFSIYGSFLYLVNRLQSKYNFRNVDKVLVLKFLLFISFIGLFSSYRTSWAFGLAAVGIYKVILKERFGWLFVFLGVGIHPVTWLPLFAFFTSNFAKFRKVYLLIALFFGIFLDKIASSFGLFSLPFIGSKVQTYVYGEWAAYRFHDRGEYLKIFLLIAVILFLLIVFFRELHELTMVDRFKNNYDNFIGWYFALALFFLSKRTIETRLMIDGFVFFIPLLYYVFASRRIYQKRIMSMLALFFWFVMIDIRTFNYQNMSYMIGSGFPFNFFDSPLFLILNN